MEFRELSIKKMKDILTDEDAIAKYEEDPFSPHAIARLRLSAYQTTIVMKYIDNLVDWGDSLFARDTMESINEATMFYVLASDILGRRPVQLGKCDTVSESRLTYGEISKSLAEGDDFLLNLENWSLSVSMASLVSHQPPSLAIEGGFCFRSLAAHSGKPRYKTQSYREMVRRHDGGCNFELPEIAYDLVYPGQYKRIIKSVRLTIPCVSGPYTNIGATLTLLSSQIRREQSDIPAEDLPTIYHQQFTSIATSTALNDGGVF